MKSTSRMTKGMFTILLSLTVVVFASDTFAQGTWTTKAPMPTARTGVATGIVNGKLYVLGGAAPGPSGLNTNEAYDPATDTWTTKAPMPTSRAYAGAAGIAGKLYVVGGCAYGDCRIGTTGSLEVYDEASNSWATKAPMPTARAAMAIGAIGGKLYVVGGNGPWPPSPPFYATLEMYDPGTDTWTTKTPMPTVRSAMGGAVINGKLDVVGGVLPPGSTPIATLEVYDPAIDTWATMTPMPQARTALGAGEVNGILYAVSGILADGTPVNTVEAYDPATDSWTTVAPIPTARYGPQPQGINGVLYVAGSGPGNTPITTLEAFTPPITPAEADQNLINTINSMTLPAGSKTSLTAPLASALNRLSDNNPTNDIAACNDLGAFINQVSAKQKAGKLTAEQAAELTSAAQAIQGALECP
jgi:N-acetylneuraminic acid mutarotase